MSWREHADLAQEVILDEMAERDATGALTVTYEPDGGTPRLVRGIFREPHVEKVLDPLAPPVSTWEVKLGVKITELLPDWPLKDASRFSVKRPSGGDPLDSSAAVRYSVVDRRLDGEGLVELYLRRRD
jgi:hypothetical protein